MSHMCQIGEEWGLLLLLSRLFQKELGKYHVDLLQMIEKFIDMI